VFPVREGSKGGVEVMAQIICQVQQEMGQEEVVVVKP
jgi:hypothetical protein